MDAALRLQADELALRLAGDELDRVGRFWAGRGLPALGDPPLHAHLAAAATLAGGLTKAAARELVAREVDALGVVLPGGPEAARAALHAALPASDGGVGPVLPDILGEAALILTWGEREDGLAALLRVAAGHRANATRVVVRACQDFLIRGRRAPLAWLKALRADRTDLEALGALSDAVPLDTVELREAALELALAIADIARSLPEGTGEAGAALRGRALNNLSLRLAAVGRRDDARAAIEEAVAIDRALSTAKPDAFGPSLAGSLNNLALCLSGLGRRDDALAAIEEAVALRRALAAARPDASLPDLAMSLNNLSLDLSDLGRRKDALAAVEEALAIRRVLAAARPDAFLPDLAASYGTRGRILAGHDPAVAAASFTEGIAALRAPFLELPAEFAPLMVVLCRAYIGACEAAGSGPDMELLAPIMAAFEEPGAGAAATEEEG